MKKGSLLLLACLPLACMLPAAYAEIESDLSTKARSTIPPPRLQASSWLLMDAGTGTVIAAQDPDQRIEPASLSKLMTAFIVFREIKRGTLSLDEEVVVSEKAWRTQGSRMFIEPGDRVRVEDLVLGLIVQSGNDAAVALAEHVAGSEDGFADLMNRAGTSIGLENTHFVNSTGLPHPDHFSSARDLSLLTAAIIRDQPEHFGYYAIREFTWNGITQKNRNPLLGRDETVDGVKTGHTSSAGYCLIGSSERKGMRLIGSVMGSRSNRERADSVYALLKFGFAAYESHDLYQAGARILSTGVFKGVVPEVNVGLADTVQLVLPKGSGAGLKAVIELVDPLVAPLVQGQQVGTLAITLGGEPLLTRPLVALAAVASGSWFDAMVDSVRLWFH